MSIATFAVSAEAAKVIQIIYAPPIVIGNTKYDGINDSVV